MKVQKSLRVLGTALSLLLCAGVGHSQNKTVVAPTAQETNPIKIGSALPKISLTAVDSKEFDLSASVAKKPTVLIFYRGGWCPYCNLQLGQLQAIEPQLLQLGYQVIAVSPDRADALNKSIEKQSLKYTLLSDAENKASSALGIAWQAKDRVLPVPAVFVIGTDGVINFSYVNPTYRVRIHPDLLLAAAKAGLAKDN